GRYVIDLPDARGTPLVVQRLKSEYRVGIGVRTDHVEAQKVVEAIPMGAELVEYAVRINFATRKDSEFATPLVKKYITWGSGPRASQAIVHASKAKAFMEGRPCVAASDIAAVSHLVLDHRLVMNFQGEAEGITMTQVIDEIVELVK
ncbi:hypothetical protein MJH12_06230, partial [bacterium]|nr:hypothetical protein [bacterium]